MSTHEAGAALARDHESADTAGLPEHRLASVSENFHANGWSLRAALVRYAQPQPVGASAVLQLTRRLDAYWKPHRKLLESDDVACRRALHGSVTGGDQVIDCAAADLGRLLLVHDDAIDALVDGYRSVREIDDALVALIPAMSTAVLLDELADMATSWAQTAAHPAPSAAVDAECAAIYRRMADVGVPMETMPEGRGPRRQ